MPRSADVPLKHERIARVLESEIRGGEYAVDQALPSEAALVKRFSASRNTVRQALSTLANEGLIATRPGVGSFVVFQAIDVDPGLGWARAIQQHGVVHHVRLVSIEPAPIGALPAELRGLVAPDTTELFRITRVREVLGGRVISLERSLVPSVPELADLPSRGLVDDSLLKTLTHAGLVSSGGEQWVDIARLTPTDAPGFAREPGSSVLVSRCETHDAAGHLVEYVESIMDPTFFRIHLAF